MSAVHMRAVPTPASDERWKRSMQAVLAAYAAGRGTPSAPRGA